MNLLGAPASFLYNLIVFLQNHYIELTIFCVLLAGNWYVKRWWKSKQRRWLLILLFTLSTILFAWLILALMTQFGAKIPQMSELETFLDKWKNNLSLLYISATILLGCVTLYYTIHPSKLETKTSFPFDWYTTDDNMLNDHHHINTLKRQLLGELTLSYLTRSEAQEQARMFRILDTEKLVIVGRRGLGKTREAIETIERIAKRKGEPVIILIPRGYLDVPSEFPGDLPPRQNLVLLINDVHELVFDEDRDEDAQRPFHDRLLETVRVLEQRLVYRNFRVIMTAIDEPNERRLGITEIFNKNNWPDFKIFHLPNLGQSILSAFIQHSANFYALGIGTDVERYIKERSDLTCAGILIPFKQEGTSSTGGKRKELTLFEAKKYHFTYPQDWEEQVYKRTIEPYPQRKYVLAALCIIRQAKLPAYTSLVMDLAARLWKGRLNFLVKRQIKHAVNNELSGLIYEAGDILYSPSVYLEGKGELERNIPALSLALKSELRNHESPLIPQLLGFIYHVGIDLNQPQPIINTIKSASNHHRNNAQLWYYLSVVYGQTGNYDGAIQAAERACKIDPKYIEARRSLALNYSFQKQYLIALEIAKRLANETNQARDWLNLSIILGKAGDFTESLEAAKRANSIDPHLIGVWHRMSVAYWNLDQKNVSLSWTRQIALTTNYARDWYNLSVAYGLCDLYIKGVIAARKALEIYPGFIKATYSLTTNLGKLGRHEEVIRLFLSVPNEKRDAEYWSHFSVAYSRASQYSNAIDVAKTAIELNPKFIEAWKSLSLAYENLGHLEDKATPLPSVTIMMRHSHPIV